MAKEYDWIHEYQAYQKSTEAPEDFHMWAAISTIATALGRSCWLDMGNHIIVPNFYIIFVSPPGIVQKSTTISASKRILRNLDEVNFGPDTVTWQAIIDTLAGCSDALEVDDGHGGIDIMTASSVYLSVSELGTFFQENDADKINLMTHLWDAPDSYSKRTRMDGEILINNPCVNFISGCTPSWIAGNLDEYFIGGGLASRSIFVYADKKAQRIPYPKDQTTDYRYKNLIDKLKEINQMTGKFSMTPEARAYGVKYYNQICDMAESDQIDPRYKGFIARMQVHLHKAAMVISAATRSDMVITENCMMRADAVVMDAFGRLPQIYNLVGQSKEVQQHEALVKIFLLANKELMTEAEMFSRVRSQMSHWNFKNSLNSVIASGQVGKKQVGAALYYYPKKQQP